MYRHRHFFLRVIFVLLSLILNSLAFALPQYTNYKGYKGAQPLDTGNMWFVGAGGGVYWAKLPSSTTNVDNGTPIDPPFNQDLYTINNPSANSVLQVSAGYRWKYDQLFLPYSSLYFQYRHYNDSTVNGSIYQYSLPDFLNYNYKMSYSADLFTVNGKLDLANIKNIMPYISGGLGIIMNRLDDYIENPTANVTPRISPGFNSNTSSRFAATVGAGIDYAITRNVWLTLGYEHVFQTSLPNTAGTNTWTGTSLNLGNVRLDTVFLNISAKFPDTFMSNTSN